MVLLDFLRRNIDSRRVFGKKELIIIEKQLLGVTLTQSEKNRLSRDIRKKLTFMSNVHNLNKEFSLKRGVEQKSIIKETIDILLKDRLASKIQRIILFGSIINHSFTLHSDIDISVEFDSISLADATLFRKRALGEAHEKVDIQVFNFLAEKIKKSIREKGKILYDRKNKRQNKRN